MKYLTFAIFAASWVAFVYAGIGAAIAVFIGATVLAGYILG